VSSRQDLESGLRRALARGEFVVHYQPQTRLADGATTSVEALIRLEQPRLGWLPPSQFIYRSPKRPGFIEPIGAWCWRPRQAQARAWRDAGLRELRMCVNVSARQLNQRFVETVSRVLAETGLPASALELEITEGVRLGRDPVTQATLKSRARAGRRFRNRRLRHRLRDLEYIKRLPVSTLKLDGLFVGGLCENADDAAIVAASVALARGLGLRLVAEGVETAGQHQWLRALGCDECQGHYVHRPLPAAATREDPRCKIAERPADRLRLVVAH